MHNYRKLLSIHWPNWRLWRQCLPSLLFVPSTATFFLIVVLGPHSHESGNYAQLLFSCLHSRRFCCHVACLIFVLTGLVLAVSTYSKAIKYYCKRIMTIRQKRIQRYFCFFFLTIIIVIIFNDLAIAVWQRAVMTSLNKCQSLQVTLDLPGDRGIAEW